MQILGLHETDFSQANPGNEFPTPMRRANFCDPYWLSSLTVSPPRPAGVSILKSFSIHKPAIAGRLI
jgi:hypothetical protein